MGVSCVEPLYHSFIVAEMTIFSLKSSKALLFFAAEACSSLSAVSFIMERDQLAIVPREKKEGFAVSQNGEVPGVSLPEKKNSETSESSAPDLSKDVPSEWSIHATGVRTRLSTSDKVLALTFDACGGAGSDGYDAELVDFLKRKSIPATLFVTAKWIAANRENFRALSENPLFEIENHGTRHLPCSVSGRSAYGIVGEHDADEVASEIGTNAKNIASLTGRAPKFYRAGTAFTDEICPRIAESLGEEVVSFSVLGDAGATYSAKQVEKALLMATPGSIVLLHMNHPEKETAEGVALAIPLLEKQEFRFVTLSQYPLK